MADKNDALAEMRERYRLADEDTREAYSNALDDIRFVSVPGNQWDSALIARRGNRPVYEFPKLRGLVMQIINEQRQARPQGKVRPVEDSDQGLAEIMQGLCRNIESTSNAEQAYDIAYESAVKGGMGVWRICTDYASDDDFEQDIRIKAIRNFTAAKCDPAAVELDRRDARYWFIEELIPKSQFEREHPGADLAGFESDRGCEKWRDKDQIKRAEYWYKQPAKKELWALSNGDIVDATEQKLDEKVLAAQGIQVVRKRVVDGHKVMMRLTNGHEWLSEPYEFPSKFIPIVPVYGNIESIEGEDYWSGAVRFAKDSQRLHNAHKTAQIETVAKAPKAPFIVKPKWIKGFEALWKRANVDDLPYLPIADDAPEGTLPQRTPQAEVPVALIQLAAMDNDDMKAAVGIYDASLGARSNETSGKAINERKQQGATATYNYIDNLVRAIRYTYEILVDMIPRVYDTPRVVRILGEDGASKWKQLYHTVMDPETGELVTLNDLSKGKYDVAVTVGPAFATQRAEAVEAFTQLAGQFGGSPLLGPLLAYAAMKNQDLPGSDEISDAVRNQLVQQGLLPPKDGEQAPQPKGPPPLSPLDMAKADQAKADADLKRAQTQKTMVEAGGQHVQNLQALQPMPPDPMQMPQPQPEPPQGGFFMPEGMPPGP